MRHYPLDTWDSSGSGPDHGSPSEMKFYGHYNVICRRTPLTLLNPFITDKKKVKGVSTSGDIARQQEAKLGLSV